MKAFVYLLIDTNANELGGFTGQRRRFSTKIGIREGNFALASKGCPRNKSKQRDDMLELERPAFFAIAKTRLAKSTRMPQ